MIEEWREYSKLLNTYLEPLPSLISPEDGRLHTNFNQAVASTGPTLHLEPEPAVDSDPHRAGARDPQRVRRRAGLPAPLGRLLAGRAAHPRARLRRAEAARGVRGGRGHPRRDGRRGARQGALRADEGRAERRQDGQLRDHLRHLRVRALGEPARSRARRRRPTSTRTSRASRTSRTSSSGRSSRPSATATRPRSSAGAARCRS